MTPAEQLAASASAFLVVSAGASALSSTVITRARAGVMRAGGGPARRRPIRTGSAPANSGARTAMRSTMPRGLSVQAASQSMKRRRGSRTGGQSSRDTTCFRLSPPADRASQTTPSVCRVPSGTTTKSPAAR